MAATPPVCDFGWRAPGFDLPATDGRRVRMAEAMGPKGLVVAFICNHCPYVVAAIGRIAAEARALAPLGIGFVGVCSNDAAAYPADGFGPMGDFARAHDLPFPYLHDAEQTVARSWGAVCTPDFFGLNAEGQLQYRGRLDAGRTAPPPPGAARELFEAMRLVAETGAGPAAQTPSMGCSIKWRAA